MRKALVAAASLTLAGLAAGCSSSVSVIDHPSGSSSVAHVGDTLDLQTGQGQPFQITLTKVADPATPTSGHPSTGKRYIGVLFHLNNTSGHTLSGDSNEDVNIIGSNGRSYTTTHQTLHDCNGALVLFKVSGGSQDNICVTFEIKKSVGVSQVQFSPAAGTATDYGQWNVP